MGLHRTRAICRTLDTTMSTQVSPQETAKEPTVIRRYTPPTCTLEIAAKQSPLSRWTGKIALKDLRFKLSFDDPRVSDDRWITLRGDRDQLEELSEAANQYVQSFLNQSSASSQVSQGGSTFSGGTLLAEPTKTSASGIAFQPKGLLSHQLLLGSLATETSGDSVSLSSTQLADLATALDEYAAEATSLPKLERAAWMAQPRNLAGVAAGLLVAVGLSTSILNGLNRSTPSTANAPTASSSDQRLAVQPPASPSPNLPTLGNLPPGVMPPLGSMTPGPSPGPTIIGALPSPSPTVSPTNAPIISNVPNANNTIAQAKPEIVNIPNPPAPKVQPADKANPTQPNAVAVAPIPGGMTDAEILRKQRALESNSSLNGADALKDAPEPAAVMPPATAPSVAARSAANNRSAQSQELQATVQASWKKPATPPAGIIEYRVTINPDGTLGSVEPRTDQAAQIQANSGIPAQGSQVAPPSADGKSTTVLLRLNADGTVNASPE